MPTIVAKAVDYSWSRPDPADLVNRGVHGVMRYLGTTTRDLSTAELERLHRAGLSVGLIWEASAHRPLDGFSAGVADARRANDLADALRAPRWLWIVYAVDFDCSPLQLTGPITDYFRGAASVGRRPVGGYGKYDVIEHLAARSLATCLWQCCGWSGTGTGSGGSYRALDGSNRRLSRHACMIQDIWGEDGLKTSTDHNAVLKAPIDWMWDGSPEQPTHEHDDQWKGMLMQPIGVNGQPGLWEITTDGNGNYRRTNLRNPGFIDVLVRSGYLSTGQALELDGPQGEDFMAVPEANQRLADDGALTLAINIMARVDAKAAELMTAIAHAVDGVETPDVDEDAIVASIIQHLKSEGGGPPLTAEEIAAATVDQLRGRLEN